MNKFAKFLINPSPHLDWQLLSTSSGRIPQNQSEWEALSESLMRWS